jgi:hypothetical protein
MSRESQAFAPARLALFVAAVWLAKVGSVPLAAQPPACAENAQVFATGAHDFLVPSGVSILTVVARGGAGGSTALGQDLGGRPASMFADVPVAAGETLRVIVGGEGGTSRGQGGGGGGATLLARQPFVPLIVAGGGGGGSVGAANPAVSDAGLTPSAKAGDVPDGGAAGAGTAGGSAGTTSVGGGGGGGITSAGGSVPSGPAGGAALNGPAAGGTSPSGGEGAFGGGGGGGGAGGGGGGGNAGGGGGGGVGGGGSSFVAAGATLLFPIELGGFEAGEMVVCYFDPAVVSVPALDETGLAVLALTLALTAVVITRRRRRAS